MTAHGVGSMSSPIVISDDEDEAFVDNHLLAPTNSSESEDQDMDTSEEPVRKPYALRPPFAMTQTLGYKMVLRMGYLPGRGLGRELDGQVEPVGVGLKRKRLDCGIGYLGPPSVLDLEEPVRLETDSKKRKKEVPPPAVEVPPKPEVSTPAAHQSSLPQTSSEAEAFGSVQSTVSEPPCHQPQQIHDRYSSTIPHPYSLLPPPLFADLHMEMALLANHPDVPGSYVPWPEFLDPFSGYDPSMSEMSLGTQTMIVPPPDRPSHGLPSKPIQTVKKTKTTLPIGNPPELDPHNKCGSFPQHLGEPQNPACTLVLDNIPTRFSHTGWVRNWGSRAGGADPVKVTVDFKSRKALVEWSDAKSARKAFSSQRLHGKGKGLIRAWWYRVGGVGSEAGVGEIEEGEVEIGMDAWADEIEDGEVGIEITPTVTVLKPFPKTRLPRRLRAKALAKASSSVPVLHVEPQPIPTPGPSSAKLIHVANVQGDDALATSNHVQASTDMSRTRHRRSTFRDGFDDHFSIASSRSASPVGEPVTQQASDKDDAEDMDMSSPMSTRLGFHGESCAPTATTPPVDIEHQISTHVHGDSNLNVPVDLGADSIILSPTPKRAHRNRPHIDALASTTDSTTTDNSISPITSPSAVSKPSPPTRIPSEPRAFKTPPVGPSFAKRSLIARQRELEESITRSKSALGISYSPPPVASASSSSNSGHALPATSESIIDKVAMESNLRRLVLESKKKKLNLSTSTSSSATPLQSPTSTVFLVANSTNGNASHPPLPSTVSPSTSTSSSSDITPQPPGPLPALNSLEDLAVSFITETIETIKPPVLKTVTSNAKLELTLKQQRLEQYISESKALMARLVQARNKEEKENILNAMRECSRIMELDSTTPQDKATLEQPTRPPSFCWPASHEDSVLVISDEEDEE
ncbi:hypothetical protein BV22DRAFT_1130921 [Leucogyrophana mollusca]|uniref:Uncharacterized protein n=1 Tax=Leucogyrophana mollusca TaxID=85980 RepID=A0ACB8BC68_9AGAM|nr:hypothetical protein BV22DRAFT_1130921 [Leucogyrophana mollusca]